MPEKIIAIREGFGKGLLEAGKKNKNIVALTADLTESTRANYFADKYPKRFFQCGICEQNMMSAAAGMATVGKIPFVNSFAAFNPGRNWDQLRVSVCYSNLNVKIHGSHAGLSVGEDGATHQILEDIAITRALPNLVVLVPSDANEAKMATLAAAKYKGAVYIRTSRSGTPSVTKDNKEFKIGKANILKKGTDVTIVACGLLVHPALEAAKELQKNNILAEVIAFPTIKPFDENTLLKSIKKTGCVVSCEEHQIIGGLGSVVSETLAKKQPVPQEFVGVLDTFGESGTKEALFEKYGLTTKDIIKAVKKVLKRK